MTIRITGMNSNLDTDSIIQELVKASSKKKDDMVKAQTKLSWKQDAWKSLNTKIYSFYNTKLYDFTMQGTFKKKSTTVADSKLASVVTAENAVNGTQTLAVKQLAKSGYLTGGKLSQDGSVKNSTRLADLTGLGADETASLKVTSGGKEREISFNGNSTISDVVKQLTNAGVTASFDETNQRIYVSAGGSGKTNDFSITAQNDNGLTALAGMGLLTREGIQGNAQYQTWAAMYEDGTDAGIKGNADFQAKVSEMAASRAASLLSTLSSSQDSIKALKESRQKLLEAQNQMQTDNAGMLDGISGDTAAEKLDNVNGELERVDSQLRYLELTEKDSLTDAEQTELDEINQKAVDNGWDMTGLVKGDLEGEKVGLSNSRTVLESVVKLEGDIANNLTSIQAAENGMADTAKVLEDYYNNDASGMTTEDLAAVNAQIQAALDYVAADETEYGVSVPASGSYNLLEKAEADGVTQVRTAYDAVNTTIPADSPSATAVRIMGQDAVISLNGAEYESATNSFTVNGLTITANTTSAVTGTDAEGNNIYEETAVNTTDDVDGIYDMVKDFFKGYNELLKELDTYYNADSAKGYEPLTDEEKDAMSDEEIKKWETKIKDSLLRRDASLGTVVSAMKTSMLASYSINGSTYNLSTFGIETLGYFNAAENEKGSYHIDGDKDDSSTSGKTDKLKTAIASDPDAVRDFFNKLTKNLYDTLNKEMRRSSNYRSIYHVYDDKRMKEEYDDYTTKIAAQEKKLTALEDKYYNQFSAMEVALAKLNSQQSSLAGLLGG